MTLQLLVGEGKSKGQSLRATATAITPKFINSLGLAMAETKALILHSSLSEV